MRISKEESKIILSTLVSFLDGENVNSKIFLHGSRIDDNQKGGDIDLFWVITDQYYDKIISKKHYLISDLSLKLNEQKIDLTIIKESEEIKHSFFNNSKKILL